MSKLFKTLTLTLILVLSFIPEASLTSETDDSVLVQMFKWWNGAFKSEEKFTEEGFAQYFTDDIVFIINGKRSPKGIKSLTERFNKIKDTYHLIEIILPMKEEFVSGDKIFTYHLNRGQQNEGDPWGGVTHVMGYVVVKNGKIDMLNFLHYDEEEGSDEL